MWGPRLHREPGGKFWHGQSQYGSLGMLGGRADGHEMRVVPPGGSPPPPHLQVDLHRVSELLHVPHAQLEATLGVAGSSHGPYATVYQWQATSVAPIPFKPASMDESESSYGSWTGQSLLAALLGAPEELSLDPYLDSALAGSHRLRNPLQQLDHFLSDPVRSCPIASARVEVSDGSPNGRVILAVKYAEPVLAWIMLVVGIVGWSSAGPTYLLLPKHLQHRSLRISAWRYGGGFAPFALFTAWKWARGGSTQAEIRRCLSDSALWPQYLMLALSVFGGFVCYGLAVTYCESMALAAGMSTINPFLQLLWDRSKGKELGPFRRAATGLATFAVFLMIRADHFHSLHGIAWAVASAMCYVVYVERSDALTSKVPFFLLMMLTFGIGAVLSAVATLGFEDTTLGRGPESLFGFLQSHHVFWVMALVDFMFILGVCGLTGCLQHVPPLVVAVAISLEPAFAITMTVLGEEQRMPSPLMVAGVATLFVASVVLGTVATLQGKEEVKVDITAATSWTN